MRLLTISENAAYLAEACDGRLAPGLDAAGSETLECAAEVLERQPASGTAARR